MTLDVRELMRRLQAGESHRAIARDLGVARKTVARYRVFAEEEGLLSGPLPSAEQLDRRLEERMPESGLPRQAFKAGPYREVIEALRGRGVEVMALYQRLRDDHGFTGSYSALLRYVHHVEETSPTGFVRLEVAPGEEAQVDFGSAGKMVDPRTGEIRKAWVFVMTLSFSRHQYSTFVFDQKVGTWLRCHREAFEYFGSVPRKIVLDNLKAAIVKAVLHDPVAQRSYRECAEHYGFLISPCRPATPRHKGKVESGVRYVKRNFLAGREVETITEANRQLLKWVEGVAGVRIHGTTKERPLERFVDLEKPALLALPRSGYDSGVWKKAKLHPDCHVGGFGDVVYFLSLLCALSRDRRFFTSEGIRISAGGTVNLPEGFDHPTGSATHFRAGCLNVSSSSDPATGDGRRGYGASGRFWPGRHPTGRSRPGG